MPLSQSKDAYALTLKYILSKCKKHVYLFYKLKRSSVLNDILSLCTIAMDVTYFNSKLGLAFILFPKPQCSKNKLNEQNKLSPSVKYWWMLMLPWFILTKTREWKSDSEIWYLEWLPITSPLIKIKMYLSILFIYELTHILTTVLPLGMLWRSLWACAQKSKQAVTPENGRPSFRPRRQSGALCSWSTCTQRQD